MDIETLYNIAKTAAQGSERMARINPVGYAAYIKEFNRLRKLVIKEFGEEASVLFPIIDIKQSINPSNVTPIFFGYYAEIATERLNTLASYLQSKLGTTDRQVFSIIDLVNATLRSSIFHTPNNEEDIQNALEIIFRARELDFRREKVPVEYSIKSYFPDFTFERLNLALEVKYCDSEKKAKIIIDEINADIVGYQTKYRWLFFVVYDVGGSIRDEHQFKTSIEGNPDVYVSVIKH